MRLFKIIGENILYLAWLQALVALFGSLYFSEVLHFPPCNLCWYQRIFMYPLILLIPAGILRKDKKIYTYVLPLTFVGTLIAFYHLLLQIGVISEAITPCGLGISCTSKYIDYLGFITIPLLSFLAFVIITLCMVIYKKAND